MDLRLGGISLVVAFLVECLVTRMTPRFAMHQRQGVLMLLGGLIGGIFSGSAAGITICSIGAMVGAILPALPSVYSRNLQAMSWRRGSAKRPNLARPLVLITDTHWTTDISDLIDMEASNPDSDWLFLGDIFHLWPALPGMETPQQLAFLGWVKATREAGAWIGYTSGNREFFLNRHAHRFDFACEGTGAQLIGENLAWEHGDLINSKNKRHRLVMLAFRSFISYLFFQLLPNSVGKKLASNTDKKITRLGDYSPDGQLRFAASEHNGRTFIIGHFHHQRTEGDSHILSPSNPSSMAKWLNGKLEVI